MITLFNRKEVRIAHNAADAQNAADALRDAGIQAQVRSGSLTNPGRQHGVPGVRADAAYTYRVYVKRADHARACAVLRRKD